MLPASGYKTGLIQLDGDMPQYISDNTDDEMSHELFINAYLKSKGAKPVDLDQFRILEGSQVTDIPGVASKKRLTNLMELSVDTSWWVRYRSSNMNPDLGDTFPNAVPTLATGKFTAIPETTPSWKSGTPMCQSITHVQAIANTAGFHFAFIEQGGTSLYASLAQRVTNAGSLADCAEHWRDRDHAFPNLARQGRQRDPVDGRRIWCFRTSPPDIPQPENHCSPT